MNMFVGPAIFEAGSSQREKMKSTTFPLRDLRKLCNIHGIHCEAVNLTFGPKGMVDTR